MNANYGSLPLPVLRKPFSHNVQNFRSQKAAVHCLFIHSFIHFSQRSRIVCQSLASELRAHCALLPILPRIFPNTV